MVMLGDEVNVRVIPTEEEAKSARFLAWRAFMARLEPTGFTLRADTQDRWWGYYTGSDASTKIIEQELSGLV